MFHRRPSKLGAVFESAWHRLGGDAIDGRVLDPAVRRAGGGRFRGVPGQRSGHQESAGPQERRTREPVAVEVAYLRTAAELVSPRLGDPGVAYVLAAAQRTDPHRGRVCAAHAEGADADEPPVGQRDHGHHGIDRAEDSARYSGRRTGRGQTGGDAKLAHSSQPRGDRRQSDWKLAAGTAVYVEAGGGALRLLPAADGGVRSGDRKTAERLAVAASGDGPPG